MLQVILTTAVCLIGAAVGGFSCYGFVKLVRKGWNSELEMWRVGAERGPSERDREIATAEFNRRLKFTSAQKALELFFMAGGPIFGGAMGLLAAQMLGLYGEGA